MQKSPPKRIAILVNSTTICEWQYQMLQKIQRNGDGTIVLAVVRGETEQSASASQKTTLALSLFYRYARWDLQRTYQHSNPLAERVLTELDSAVPTVSMTPQTTRWSDSLSNDDLEILREHKIDLIIRLGWRILTGELLNLPRYGVWSYHHGDNLTNRGGPPAVWEHFSRQHWAGVTLQVLSEKLDAGLVLDRSFVATHKSSVSNTRNALYWRSADMLPRKLKELGQVGHSEFVRRAKTISPSISFYSQPLLTEKGMSLTQVLRHIAQGLFARIREFLHKRFLEEKWVLYFRLNEELSTALFQFTKLESGNDRYWADPHIIKRGDSFYIYVEEYMYDTERGHISVIPVGEDGTVGDVKTVLKTDYHLSYPSVFEHDGETYMIPDSGENRTIDLYKCISFPDKWQLEKTLMSDVYSVDTTLLEHDGRWWMFTNLCDTECGNTHDELHLFSAPHFVTDNWTPHPQGVVVSDVRCARPAGAIFKKDGKLYRPAQDCSVGYGYALQLQLITELNDQRYQEQSVARITPDWNPNIKGVHTLNHVSGMTVVDAKTFIRKSAIV